MPKTPIAVSKYMAEIGRRGGQAQKGSALRRELNVRAAEIRWRKQHPKPIEIEAENIQEIVA